MEPGRRDGNAREGDQVLDHAHARKADSGVERHDHATIFDLQDFGPGVDVVSERRLGCCLRGEDEPNPVPLRIEKAPCLEPGDETKGRNMLESSDRHGIEPWHGGSSVEDDEPGRRFNGVGSFDSVYHDTIRRIVLWPR